MCTKGTTDYLCQRFSRCILPDWKKFKTNAVSAFLFLFFRIRVAAAAAASSVARAPSYRRLNMNKGTVSLSAFLLFFLLELFLELH